LDHSPCKKLNTNKKLPLLSRCKGHITEQQKATNEIINVKFSKHRFIKSGKQDLGIKSYHIQELIFHILFINKSELAADPCSAHRQ